MKSILLVEPPYRNKYHPIGLMKISSYHKILGDDVTYIKGNISDSVIKMAADDVLSHFSHLDINFNKSRQLIISHSI